MVVSETTITVHAEHTDTFGGEANYSWVKRCNVSGNSDRDIVRKVKKEFGLTGIRCRREDWGDMIVLRPVGYCQVVFIQF